MKTSVKTNGQLTPQTPIITNTVAGAQPVNSEGPAPERESQAVETDPQPAPELTRAELIAHRTMQLNRLNTIARQVTRLQEMYSELGKFHFEVTSDEERHYSTIVLTDDTRKDFRISNAALCQMLADFLKEKLGEKLTEKQAELLAIEL